MTIFGDEKQYEYPVMNMFDNQLMLANVSAAKDMYDQAQKQQQDFMNKYGEFVSPNKNDTQNWYNITTGRVADVLDQMRKANIDPLRSQEGRSMVAQLINTMPYGEMAKMRERSALMQEYEKNRAELEAKGLYNPNYEKFRLGGKTIENWDASKDGDWTSTSPAQFQDLYGATNKWFEGMQPKYDATASKATGGRYDIYSVSNKDLNRVVGDQLNDFKNTQLGAYYYDQAYNQIKAYNPNLTEEQLRESANHVLSTEIVNRNSKALQEKREPNEYAVAAVNHAYYIDTENRRYAHDVDIATIKANARAANTPGTQTYSYTKDLATNAINSYANNIGLTDIQKQALQSPQLNSEQKKSILRGNNSIIFNNLYGQYKNNPSLLRDNFLKHLSHTDPNEGFKAVAGQHVYNPNYGFGLRRADYKQVFMPEEVINKIDGTGRVKASNINLDFYKQRNRILGITPATGNDNMVTALGKDGKIHHWRKITITLDTNQRTAKGQLINPKETTGYYEYPFSEEATGEFSQRENQAMKIIDASFNDQFKSKTEQKTLNE